jgi:hypothetical protein
MTRFPLCIASRSGAAPIASYGLRAGRVIARTAPASIALRDLDGGFRQVGAAARRDAVAAKASSRPAHHREVSRVARHLPAAGQLDTHTMAA